MFWAKPELTGKIEREGQRTRGGEEGKKRGEDKRWVGEADSPDY